MQRKGSFLSSLIGLLLFVCFIPGITIAQDAPDCATSLDNAQSAYFNGEFDRVITLIQPCLDSESYTQSQGIRAYSLLGRTQFVLGASDAATDAIRGLYQLDPAYEPDPQLPPDFSAFMLNVKQTMIADGSFPAPEPEVIETPDPPEVAVTDILPEQEVVKEEKPQKRRRALLFGGGAAIAVAAGAAILLSGNSGGGDPPPTSTEWPLPPAHP